MTKHTERPLTDAQRQILSELTDASKYGREIVAGSPAAQCRNIGSVAWTMERGMSELQVYWIDRGREPKCAPNPDFPDGMDADLSLGAERTCSTALPYPAKRCGLWLVKCSVCGITVAITTAGRPDDPRSAKVPCKITGAMQ